MSETAFVTGATTRSIVEFDDLPAWPRGARLEAIREASAAFRERFRAAGTARAVKTVDIGAVSYPARYAFHGAARTPNPYVTILGRMTVVQYEDFNGQARTLVFDPAVPEGTAEAPFFGQLAARYGEFLSNRVFSKRIATVEQALRSLGLRPADVDYFTYDHLHVQDVGLVDLPAATLLTQRAELGTLESMHPLQWAWYVPHCLDKLPADRHLLLDGDVELGAGVALLATPGHTDGNHSLCVNTDTGVWCSSENGVAADNWHPEHSRIPGVRTHAEFMRHEVVMNANTLEDSLDQYDSMVKEKTVADPCPRDPRFSQVIPSSELVTWKRGWPVRPTYHHGGIDHGRIERNQT